MANRRTCADMPWEDEAESNLHKLDQRKSKINRLKRSPKPSQPSRTVDTSDITQPEFKTPTRPIKTKFGRLIGKDSPCNDYENQHDIIWDQNSPSPIGKGALYMRGRGRRKETYTRKTDVNDLVSRIAPKNWKPVDSSESSVLQWIGVGDIPCTPELSQPRTKTKLTRQDTHDHLKQLAMQFDFQLIRHEDPLRNKRPTQAPDQQDEDLDLFGDQQEEDLDLFGNQQDEDLNLVGNEDQAPRPPANPLPRDAIGALSLDQDMDEDDDELLNELFDGPTVSIENGLSQPLSVATQNTKPTASASPSGNATASGGSDMRTRGHVQVPRDVTPAAGGGGVGGLDDDWDDDGLLDDSMVMELTQNPHLFAPPKHSSTQKPHASQPRVPSGTAWPTNISNQFHQQGGSGSSSRGFGSSQVLRGIYKSGQPFKPVVNTNHQVKTSPVGGGLPSNSGNGVQSSQPVPSLPCASSDFPNKPSKAVSTTLKALNQPCTRTRPEASAQRCSAPWRPSSSTGAQSEPSQTTAWPERRLEAVATVEEPRGEVLIPADDAGLQDDDLDVFFALDCGWDDDVDDDDLLCEACDDVDVGAVVPADHAVPTAKQPFSNGQVLNQNWNRIGTPSVSTAVGTEHKTHHQKPGTTFAEPFPTCRTVYSTSASSAVAKCVPPVTQRTVAKVSGSSNAQHQGISTRPPATAGVGATSSFRGSSHQTTGHHLGGVSSNSPTGPFSFNLAHAAAAAAGVAACVEPQRLAHAKENTFTANQLAWKGGGVAGSNQSSVRMGGSASSSRYTFKRPTHTKASDSCSTVTTPAPAPYPVPGMCSEAEIERKKQEALERRRLRMLATQNPNQNLRVPC